MKTISATRELVDPLGPRWAPSGASKRHRAGWLDTAELAEGAGIEHRLALQMTQCLRAMGVLDMTGKRSGAFVHRAA